MKPQFQYIIIFIVALLILFVFFWLFQTKTITKEEFTPYIRGLYRPYVRGFRIHGSNLYKSSLQKFNRWNKIMF